MATDMDRAFEAVTVRPGDMLLLRFSHCLSDEEMSQLMQRFKSFKELTGVQVCVIEGCDQIVCVRSAGGED